MSDNDKLTPERAVRLPPCPTCGGELRLVMKLEATNGLVGGSQLKVAVREWPHLVCDCGFSERGEVS